jgi:hypothetical protein
MGFVGMKQMVRVMASDPDTDTQYRSNFKFVPDNTDVGAGNFTHTRQYADASMRFA